MTFLHTANLVLIDHTNEPHLLKLMHAIIHDSTCMLAAKIIWLIKVSHSYRCMQIMKMNIGFILATWLSSSYWFSNPGVCMGLLASVYPGLFHIISHVNCKKQKRPRPDTTLQQGYPSHIITPHTCARDKVSLSLSLSI